MTLHIKLINEIVLLLLLSIIKQSNAEYYVKGGTGKPLSYLKYNFTNISSNIFPNNLEVKLVMWHTIGTLIYSMDKNGNQFILEVLRVTVPYLRIKIRGKKKHINLIELCGFKQNYKQENVTLLMKIKETNLFISCNANNEFFIEVQNKKDIYPLWPVPPFPNSPHNQAILWALNVPNKYGGNSDPYQIGCCLFYVKYNNKVINMTPYGSRLKNKCPRSCTLYPCNSNEICNEKYTDMGQKYCYSRLSGPVTITTVDSTFSNSKLNVTWTPPDSPNGFITKYYVVLRSSASYCIMYWSISCTNCEGQSAGNQGTSITSGCSNKISSITFSKDDTSFNVNTNDDKIKPFTNYSIIIQARNEWGYGSNTSTKFTSGQYITTTQALPTQNAHSNLKISITVVSILVLAIIVIPVIICIYYRRRRKKEKRKYLDDIEEIVRLISINYLTNPIETQYSPDSPILIGFGVRYTNMMHINESINEHLTKYNLSCNTVCTDIPNKRAIMIDIMQCKVVVVVYNFAEPNIEICEFMCQLTEQYGKQLIPLVISTDKFIRNENMRKLLQNHDNLMYFDDVWSIRRGAPKIANKIKHYLDIYTPIEVAPLPKTDNNVI